MDPKKIEKWNKWIWTIYKDVVKLVEHQQIFEKVQGIIGANLEIRKPNEFYRFLEDTYGAFIAIGIRRQIKPQKGGSLVGLLEDIRENPSVLSRRRFVELYPANMQLGASHIFDERFLGSCTDHIDLAIVQRDLDKLETHTGKVEKYADKCVAHTDKQVPPIPTFAELDPPIDCLKKLVIKYSLLLKAEDLTNNFIPPFIPEVDMEVIFRVPWIRSD